MSGHPAHALALVRRNLQHGRIRAAHLGDQSVSEELDELPGKVRGILAFGHELIQQTKRFFAGIAGHRAHQLFHYV